MAGITRQSYAAIENGHSVPSTDVALRLSRALGLPVEALFQLPDEILPDRIVESAGLGSIEGRRVRIARIAGRKLAYPLQPGGVHAQHFSDGVGEGLPDGRVRIRALPDPPRHPDLVVAGCDPAFGLVIDVLRREHDLEILWAPAGSRAALEALARGAAHVAGVHLRDPDNGVYNTPWIRRIVPCAATRVSFAIWEQHLCLRAGNPLGVESVADLARPGLRFLNREEGSGSRALVELRLAEAGIPTGAVPGFEDTAADGHGTVAAAVAAGAADAGVAIGAAARACGLSTVSLGQEPYELVIPNHFLELPAVEALLGVLRRPALRRQVEAMGGYDAAAMGDPA